MIELIYDKKQIKSYKEFYEKIYIDLEGKDMIDWEDYKNLEYRVSMLDEFLWYCQDCNIHFIFKNFDLEKIKQAKSYDDYEWSLIFKVVNRFVTNYPNNTLEFINEE